MTGTFELVARENPLRFCDRRTATVAAGSTLADALRAAGLNPDHFAATVFVDDLSVPRERWETFRPQPGAIVAAIALPAGGGGSSGGGKQVGRLLALIAVAVAAPAAGALTAEALGFQAGTAAFSVASGVATAGYALGGTLAVNALIPPPKLDGGAVPGASGQSPITGSRNAVARFGTVPSVLGRVRVFPPMAALPHTETHGKKTYFVQVFDFGPGPLEFSDLRIGDNPLFADDTAIAYTGILEGDGFYRDVEVEVRQGTGSDAAITLYSDEVHERGLQRRLLGRKQTGVSPATFGDPKPATERTLSDTEEISVDISWPAGIAWMHPMKGPQETNVKVKVEYKLATALDSAYVEAPGSPINKVSKSTSPITANLRWKVAKGQYDVKVTRQTPEALPEKADEYIDDTYWTQLRSIRKRAPVSVTGHALVAIRIKQTGQLAGVIDQFSAVVQRKLSRWNGSAWAVAATRDPAAAFRHVLQGAENRQPAPDAQLHLASIQAWSTFCDDHGFEYNAVHDTASSVFEVLQGICRAGRASFAVLDGQYGVIIDEAQSTPRQAFGPRNSGGHRYTRTWPRLPHAVKARFRNEQLDYQWDEQYVYDDGYSADGAGSTDVATEFEGMDMLGVTIPWQAWALARYHLAVGRLVARHRYECDIGIEHLAVTRGDLVQYAHDVVSVGLGSGRVTAVTLDGSGDCTSITVDEPFTMAASSYGVRIRRSSDLAHIVRTITTVAGAQTTLSFATAIPAASPHPAVGDLVFYGEASLDTIPCLVHEIRPRADLSARLALIPYDADVYQADTTTPPEWAKQRADGEVVENSRVPTDAAPTSSSATVSTTKGEADKVTGDTTKPSTAAGGSTSQASTVAKISAAQAALVLRFGTPPAVKS